MFVPYQKGVYSIKKEFAPTGSKFFPYRADLISEGDWCAAKQTGSHKSCLPCEKWQQDLEVYPFTIRGLDTLEMFCCHFANAEYSFCVERMLPCYYLKEFKSGGFS